jgi:hypothetical protein
LVYLVFYVEVEAQFGQGWKPGAGHFYCLYYVLERVFGEV